MGKIVQTVEDLTEKQRRFIDNYVKSGNAARSARDAGYVGSPSTIGSQANKLLNHPVVSKEIERRIQESVPVEKLATTPEEVMKHMCDIFYGRLEQKVATKTGVVWVPPLFREQVQAGRYIMQALGMFDRKDKGPKAGKTTREQLDDQFASSVRSLGFDGEEDDGKVG